MAEILIKNGLVFDGSGKEGVKQDIFIKGDRVDDIGIFPNRRAETVINASGSFVAPGFIDINSDSDHYLTLFNEPEQISLLKQGVTTILGGNCGSSLAPLIQGNLISIRKWTNPNQINIDWQTFGEFLDKLSKLKLGVNFGTLIGHSTIRRGILGEELRDLTEGELKEMKYIIERSLSEGALGVSTGLSYSHARLTPQYEISEILKITEKYNGLYATHLRSEDEGLISAVAELDDLTSDLENSPRIEISHLKAYENLQDDLNQSLKIIDNLATKGIDINFDVYPYNTTADTLYLYLPQWAIHGGLELMVKNIKDKIVRQRIIKDLKVKKYDYSKIIVAEISQASSFVGKSIAELARNRGLVGEEMLLDVLSLAGGRVIVFDSNLSSEGVNSLLKQPLAIIASNGPGRNYDKKPGILPHPRSFGAFPRFLSLVREKGILGWSEAIKKITSLPAHKIGLAKRGEIKKGYFADLVIFDPEIIGSRANFQNPYFSPDGIEFVIVNGQLVVKKSNFSGILAGRIFKR